MVRSTGKTIQGNENTTRLIRELKANEDENRTLNKEEERQMIEANRHDREKLNKLLILHNMKIVFNIAKKYKEKTDDFDSLIQDGMVGLAEAAKRFDIDSGIKFITYAHMWVKKYVLSSFYQKNIEVDKHSTSLNAFQTSSKDGDQVEFAEYVNDYVDPSYTSQKDIDDELSAHDQMDICKHLMDQLAVDNSLSSTDKQVFVDMFYNKEKTADIADKYDITREQILDIKHKILGKFKGILQNQYGIDSYQQVR